MALVSAPLTFLLGLAGWHYKSFVTKVDEIEKKVEKVEVVVHEHNVHVAHINENTRKIESKIDYILKKLDEIK